MEEETKELKNLEEFEEKLTQSGVLVPANDLVHYMTRNACYMKLINSDEFQESGIVLEDILTDDFITEQFEFGKKVIEAMSIATEVVINKMKAEESEEVEDDNSDLDS